MRNLTKFDHAKEIIRNGIKAGISFAELREMLPGWRKRPLQSLIFDVMEEMQLKTVPFAGMVTRPRLSRKPLPIDQNGNICIAQLLEEKGFSASGCAAFPHVGNNKITLTIKANPNHKGRDEEIYG